jgi:phosphomethylpyrimidine synthase
MCGHDWCSVRISREIVEFCSGKDGQYQWDKPRPSPGLSPEQQEILVQRGVLSPAQVHQLATATRQAMGGQDGRKAACHSDYVDPQTAQAAQRQKLVQLGPRPAPGPAVNDTGR